jgi:hypothetical protein
MGGKIMNGYNAMGTRDEANPLDERDGTDFNRPCCEREPVGTINGVWFCEECAFLEHQEQIDSAGCDEFGLDVTEFDWWTDGEYVIHCDGMDDEITSIVLCTLKGDVRVNLK